MNIGLAGFAENDSWKSVSRISEFYINTIKKEFNIKYIEDSFNGLTELNISSLLVMNSSIGWRLKCNRIYPLILLLNGGIVLHQDLLYKYLPRITSDDTLIVTCDSDKKILGNIIIDNVPKIKKVNLPINIESFKPLNKKFSRERLPIPNSDFLVGYVGRILPQKNLHVFLKMFAKLKDLISPYTLKAIIIGEFWGDYPILDYVTKEYPGNIKTLIAELEINDDIFIFKKLNDENLCIAYNAMDILIHPTHSIDENFGYVPLEAMACGTPVIGSAYGGLKDHISAGSNGYLMPTWTTESGIRMDIDYGILKAKELLMNYNLKKSFSLRAISYVKSNYTTEHCEKLLLEVLSEAKINFNNFKKQVVVGSKPFIIKKEYLPKIAKPWNHYKNAVSYYVNKKSLQINDKSIIKFYSHIEIIGDDYIKLCDDAWPAKFRLCPTLKLILEPCANGISFKELVEKYNISRHFIKKYINRGLLTISNTRYYSSVN